MFLSNFYMMPQNVKYFEYSEWQFLDYYMNQQYFSEVLLTDMLIFVKNKD